MIKAPPGTPMDDEALPAAVAVGGASRLLSYRRYPVFSAAWLRKRALLFSLLIGLLALIAALVSDSLLGRTGAGWLVAQLVFVRFMLIAFAGPGLAGLVRARAAPLPPAAWRISLAVVTGLVIAAAVAHYGLRPVEQQLRSTTVTRVSTASPDATVSEQSAGSARPIVLPGEGSSLVIAGQLRPSPWLAATSLIADVALYLLLGGGLALFAWFGERRRLEAHRQELEIAVLHAEKQRSEMRLGLLQSQVEPHFLFNTFAALRSLLRSDPARAEAMLDALVDYLRATIPRLRADAGSMHSTLADQIDLCRRYLELMQLRMGARLHYRVELPAALHDLPFPPLLLISLVENAIKHGIEPKPGAGSIDLRAQRLGDDLEVSVCDDGVGLKPGLGAGLGLANIRAHLATRYGERAALSIRNRDDGDGVIAAIRVPLTESRS